MSDRELGRLFDQLTPPPGGLADLRRRIDRRAARRRRGFRLATACAGVAVVALLALWLALPLRSRGPAPWLDRDDLYAVRLGLVAPPSEPVTVPAADKDRVAVQRVATRDPRIVFYRVGFR